MQLLDNLMGGKKNRVVECKKHDKIFTDRDGLMKHLESSHSDTFRFREDGD